MLPKQANSQKKRDQVCGYRGRGGGLGEGSKKGTNFQF